MTILAVGNEGDSFVGGLPSGQQQTACKDALARGGVIGSSSNRHQVQLSSAVSSCWVHGWTSSNSDNNAAPTQSILSLYDETSGLDVFRIVQADDYLATRTPYLAQYWDGSAYVDIARFDLPTFTSSSSGFEYDYQFVSGASGRFRFYVERQLTCDVSGSFVISPTTWDKARFGGPTTLGWYHGSIVVAVESTVGMRLDSLIPNATATNSGWTNPTVANLADTTNAPAVNQSTFGSTNSIGAVFTLNYENPASFATIREAKGVSIATCGIIQSGSGFTTASLYVNGTTLASLGLSTSFTSNQQFLATDPSTSTAWTNTSISNMTVGVITA